MKNMGVIYYECSGGICFMIEIDFGEMDYI